MKILFCTNKFDEVSNGPAKFANLLLQINERYPEHELRVLTEDITEERQYVYKLLLRYPPFLSILSQFFRIFAYHYQAKQIKENGFDFDVIVYNNAFIGLLSAIVFPRSVGMINDDNNAARNWRNFKPNKLFIKQMLFKQLERLSLVFFDKIIVNSDFLMGFLERVYAKKGHKFVKLYKCIEPVAPRSFRPIPPQDIIKVLFVKADFNRGGLQDLIQALNALPFQFCLTVIGPEDRFFAEIQGLTLDSQNIELNFLGQQKQARVFEEMLDSAIFCVPSHQEALGVANLEALARGVPVVSTKVGGIPEILDHGNNGWLALPSNPSSLALAIEACITKEEERKIKVNAGISFSKKFYLDECLNQFLKILANT